MSSLHKLAEMISIGRIRRNNVYDPRLPPFPARIKVPLYLGNNQSWNQFNKLRKELYKSNKHTVNIVRNAIAKNKQRVAHTRSENRDLRALENKVLYAVQYLQKHPIKNRLSNTLQGIRKKRAAQAAIANELRAGMQRRHIFKEGLNRVRKINAKSSLKNIFRV